MTLPGNPFSRVLLTIGIENANVRLMAVEGRKVIGWLSVPFNPKLVSDGRIDDPSGLSTVIKQATARLGLKPGAKAAAFPSPRITSHVITLPDVRGMHPDSVLPREARRIMGAAVDYHDLFWTPLGKAGLTRRYYLLAAPRAELVTFFQALAQSGLRPRVVDARGLALTRGVGAASAFIFNVEAYGLDVLVVSDYVPVLVSHRELQLGQGIGNLAEDMIDEFQNSTEQYRDRVPSAPLPQNAPVYLTGGHPLVNADLLRALQRSLGRELLIPEPPMQYPEDFPLVQYMVNVGLALKCL